MLLLPEARDARLARANLVAMRTVWLLPLCLLSLASCIAATEHAAPRAYAPTPAPLPDTLTPDPTTRTSSLLLFMPVDGVRVADVINTFGAPRGQRWHEGVDVFADRGTPVRPAAPGNIAMVGETGLGGLGVTVMGDDGLRYFYTHLDAVPGDLAVGQRVSVLDVIGFVGNSGNAAGGPPHLHFAVYARGDAGGWMAFDPIPHLIDRSSGG